MKNEDKYVLITGASSGIGKEVAKQLSEENYNLVLCARRYEKLKKVKKECKKLGANKVHVFQLDISKNDSIDHLIIKLQDLNINLNVLINNAGFGNSDRFTTIDFEIIKNMFAVNVTGLMYLTQQVINKSIMDNQNEKQIINIASMAGKISSPDFSIYAATKAAVISFSDSLRIELRNKNIQVTVINLGPVKTPFFDQLSGHRKQVGLKGLFTLDDKKAGNIVLKAIGKNKREINRPIILNLGEKFYRLSPKIGDYFLKKYYQN